MENNFNKIGRGFSPGVTDPNYFMRNGLKKAIHKYAGQLSGKLMDFGCGSKPYKSFFTVSEYVGVDFENEGHPHINEQIDIFYDGKKIPVADNYFDSVLCSEVIEHIFNLDEVLQEINRVTKKGGKLLFTCPFMWSEHEVPHDFARYTRFALEDRFRKAGFEVAAYEKSGNFITTIAQMICIYSYVAIYPKVKKVFFLRWAYKFFLVLMPNLTGKLLNRILPANDTLYLSNIILLEKR